MPVDKDLVIVGQFGSPHGVRGWVKLNSYTKPIDNVLNYQPWYLKTKNGWQVIVCSGEEIHAKGVVVKISGYDHREAAQMLTNSYIAVKREQLPELDAGEYYWNDLVGLTVINLENIELGKVSYLIETGANDVMVVTGDKQHLIPYLPGNTIHSIDLTAGKITVDWSPDF